MLWGAARKYVDEIDPWMFIQYLGYNNTPKVKC